MSVLHTLTGTAHLQREIRKSRFLAQAEPVAAPEAALAFVARAGAADATHNCWAYRIGDAYRFSDDGEPGGTAGRPILQAIDGQGFDRVAVVVTRWFGGVKLGAGGLVRAYGGCAAECLRLAARAPIVDRVAVQVRCDFASAATLLAHLRDHDAENGGEHYDADSVRIDLLVPRERVDALTGYVRDLTRGRGTVAADRADSP
jgi:uncharacterized YigZ family protein